MTDHPTISTTLDHDWTITTVPTAGTSRSFRTTAYHEGRVAFARTYTSEEAARYGHSTIVELIKRIYEA